MTYSIPTTAISDDKAANLAHFLLENTGSVCGKWAGRMSAKDQRALFGRFLGKGRLIVDGARERLQMVVTVAFGMDFDVRESIAWRDL